MRYFYSLIFTVAGFSAVAASHDFNADKEVNYFQQLCGHFNGSSGAENLSYHPIYNKLGLFNSFNLFCNKNSATLIFSKRHIKPYTFLFDRHIIQVFSNGESFVEIETCMELGKCHWRESRMDECKNFLKLITDAVKD